MDKENIYSISGDQIPFLLQQIPQPPEKLYVNGKLPDKDTRVLCVVGPRRHSTYGEEVCKKLISGLSGYNICIVSGLAYGIDTIAHRAALDARLQTISFPGSGLDPNIIYPIENSKLAEEIIYNGGGLISEFEMTQPAMKWVFPKRNRLMAGISHATVIIEAREKSGTSITARLTLEYNRELGAVPGQITSPLAKVPNNFISEGAKIIRDSNDILEMLGFSRKNTQSTLELNYDKLNSLGETERKIINILQKGPSSKDLLLRNINIDPKDFNVTISSMEMEGYVKEKEGILFLS